MSSERQYVVTAESLARAQWTASKLYDDPDWDDWRMRDETKIALIGHAEDVLRELPPDERAEHQCDELCIAAARRERP